MRDKRVSGGEKGTKEDCKRISAAKEPGADLKLEIYINFTWIHFFMQISENSNARRISNGIKAGEKIN